MRSFDAFSLLKLKLSPLSWPTRSITTSLLANSRLPRSSSPSCRSPQGWTLVWGGSACWALPMSSWPPVTLLRDLVAFAYILVPALSTIPALSFPIDCKGFFFFNLFTWVLTDHLGECKFHEGRDFVLSICFSYLDQFLAFVCYSIYIRWRNKWITSIKWY